MKRLVNIFLRDLSNFGKQCIYESEIFQSACRTYHNLVSSSPDRDYNHLLDSRLFISTVTKSLIYTDGTAHQGHHVLKNGKVALQIKNQDFQRKQFLRHFSTLLYYKWKKENKDLVEVQAMWVFYPQKVKAKHHIYVAVNPYEKTFDDVQRKKFHELSGKKKEKDFRKLINNFTDVYVNGRRNYTLRRYNRVKEKFDSDIKFIMDTFKSMENSLKFEFISSKSMNNYSEKHAEEILCDKVQEILEYDNCQNPIFYIYGKK